jgi:hypothetical protein
MSFKKMNAPQMPAGKIGDDWQREHKVLVLRRQNEIDEDQADNEDHDGLIALVDLIFGDACPVIVESMGQVLLGHLSMALMA